MAATLIVLVHAWLFTGGFGGLEDSLANRAVVRLDTLVSLFFVMSAFLLYRPMIAHRGGGPRRPAVKGYALGRFLRIYPAYWVALTGLGLAVGLAGVFSADWWSFYSLYVNIGSLFAVADCGGLTFLCGLPQTWTLTTEVTFYIALPFFAALTALIARGRPARSWIRLELALILALALAELLLSVPPLKLRDEPWFQFSALGHLYWLGLGLGLAVLSVGREGGVPLPRWLAALAERPAISWGGALVTYLVLVAALPAVPFPVADDTTAQFLVTQVGQGIFAFLVLVPVLLGNPNAALPRRVLANPVIAWLGLVSYGLFLYHVTIAYLLGAGGLGESFAVVLVATLALSIPLAAASYYWVELPLMRWYTARRR